jgi:hypothetical protein
MPKVKLSGAMQIGTGAHYHMPAQKYKRDVIRALAGPSSTVSNTHCPDPAIEFGTDIFVAGI